MTESTRATLDQESPLNTRPLLLPEVAFATRIIRSTCIPSNALRWLANPRKARPSETLSANAAVREAIHEIVRPIADESSGWRGSLVVQTSENLAILCEAMVQLNELLDTSIGERMLAVGFLPLYRSLATGNIDEGLEQTRHRLFETIVALTLCDELAPDLFELSAPTGQSPYETANELLEFDLVGSGSIMRRHLSGYIPEEDRFLDSESNLLQRIDRVDLTRADQSIPDWAHPELLWRLSGELISQKTDLVLPRPWIDTPVPWHSIIDHWNSLWHLLHQDTPTSESKSAQAGEHDPESPEIIPPEITAPDVPASNDENPSGRPAKSVPPLPLPKVLIAEILSHNDPAFVSLVKRQLANCRADNRSIAIASLVIAAEDAAKHQDLRRSRKGGICPWQQKLVNELADRPEVSDPFAFITADNELWLCMLDIERSDATTLLREVLDELLSKPDTVSASEGLAKVSPPARYFVGIASTGAPNAGLTPEQMVEATCRCLNAASRQNKAAIKSIEVY